MAHATTAQQRHARLHVRPTQATARRRNLTIQYSAAADTGFFARGAKFQDLGLSPVLVGALERAGFTEPAHIQVHLLATMFLHHA